MDIDNDLSIILKSLQTTEKDVLITTFQDMIKHRLDRLDASFFLEMHNWNLQNALGDFYDNDNTVPLSQLSMKYVTDANVQEDLYTTVSMKFSKIWKIMNDGKVSWPYGCKICYYMGDQVTFEYPMPIISPLTPLQMQELTIQFLAPEQPGIYTSQLKMLSPSGTWFGDVIWLIINVNPREDLSTLSNQISDMNLSEGELEYHPNTTIEADFYTKNSEDFSNVEI